MYKTFIRDPKSCFNEGLFALKKFIDDNQEKIEDEAIYALERIYYDLDYTISEIEEEYFQLSEVRESLLKSVQEDLTSLLDMEDIVEIKERLQGYIAYTQRVLNNVKTID